MPVRHIERAQAPAERDPATPAVLTLSEVTKSIPELSRSMRSQA